MFIEITVALLIVVLLLYLVYEYLMWSKDYYANAEIDPQLKTTTFYTLAAPEYWIDSWNPVREWLDKTSTNIINEVEEQLATNDNNTNALF